MTQLDKNIKMYYNYLCWEGDIVYKGSLGGKVKSVFLVIGALALYLVLYSLINVLNVPYKGIIQLILFAGVAIAVYFMMRVNFCSYEYHIVGNELIFSSKIGNVERPIVHFPVSDVEFVALCGNEMLENIKEERKYNFKKSVTSEGVYVLVFRDEKKKKCKLFFEPTKIFLSKLSEAGVCIK